MFHSAKLPLSFEYATLVELLCSRAAQQPERRIFTFLLDGEQEEAYMTYGQLDQQSRIIAAQLQQQGAANERVLLLYPPGLDFIAAFFGCLYAGAVAVPAYPPPRNRPDPRLLSIIDNATPKVALTETTVWANIQRRMLHHPELEALEWLVTDDAPSELAAEWQAPAINGDSLAFLQYTSGSTGTPKGVMVTHTNLLYNSAQQQACSGYTPEKQGVIWLPPYHDMGLIGGILQPVYGNFPVTLMSPMSFLIKPLNWLSAISRYKATHSGAPNFAYDLCVRQITPEQRVQLDLSTWEVAFSGAEPVRAETIERFTATFGACGFRREAFYPSYGMAETTLFITGGVKEQPPIYLHVDKAALEQNQVIPAPPAGELTQTLVGCGYGWFDQQVIIVEPQSLNQLEAGQVGEIWVSGSNVALGYWNRPAETATQFQAYLNDANLEGVAFLRTGDLGFMLYGELFVTGRLKDLIIIRGRNHYPQDIELTVEQSHPALQVGSGAAFAVEINHQEELVVAQELKRSHWREFDVDEVATAIRQAVSEKHELQVYGILFIRPGNIPKTSSGKIQRGACRAKFMKDGQPTEDKALIAHSLLLDTEVETKNSSPSAHPLISQLRELDAQSRQTMLQSFLQQQIAQALRLSPEQVPPHLPLSRLGIDSLMIFELKNRLESGLNISLPPDFLKLASVNWLVKQALTQWATNQTEASAIHAQQTALTGAVPLTQIQHYFFEKEGLVLLYPDHWNATALIEIKRKLEPRLLKQAIQHLLYHHDALRLRFVAQKDSENMAKWQQFYSIPDDDLPFSWHDLCTLSKAEQKAAITSTMSEAQKHINLSAGPLLQIMLFEYGTHQELLFIIHHLIFDGLSILTLMADLQSAYRQLSEKQAVQLAPKTTSYAYWAQRLEGYANAEALQADLSYWLNITPVAPIPVDQPNGIHLEGSADTVIIKLSPQESALFRQQPQHRQLLNIESSKVAEAILLAAFGEAYTSWSQTSSLLIELERHGREPLFSDVDLSRTVGFFNNRFPAQFNFNHQSEANSLEDKFNLVLNTLQQIPEQGILYGIVRYLSKNKEIVQKLQALPQPNIKFIYSGQLVNQILMLTSQDFGAEGLNVGYFGMNIAPQIIRAHHLAISAHFIGPQLQIELRYSNNQYQRTTIEQLTEAFIMALRQLINYNHPTWLSALTPALSQ